MGLSNFTRLEMTLPRFPDVGIDPSVCGNLLGALCVVGEGDES